MHRKIKGSRLVVLSPASHFANRDQPEPWNRAVLDFLARVERPAAPVSWMRSRAVVTRDRDAAASSW
jgi:hypothetical protein